MNPPRGGDFDPYASLTSPSRSGTYTRGGPAPSEPHFRGSPSESNRPVGIVSPREPYNSASTPSTPTYTRTNTINRTQATPKESGDYLTIPGPFFCVVKKNSSLFFQCSIFFHVQVFFLLLKKT